MRFGELFAGIGGLGHGLERAGMQCAWQVERDEFCRRVLAKHWPAVPRYDDVCAVGATELAGVDLICGGFPCQPHSLAGKREGASDSRNLWPEFLRIVHELQPRWVVGENVPGIDSTMLSGVCADLEGEGYQVAVLGIPACSVGAPHKRERRLIVADANQPRLEGRKRSSVRERTGERTAGARGASAQLADTERGGRDGRAGFARQAAGAEPSVGGGWQPEPGVGRETDGLSAGLDRPWLGGWEGDTPRTATGIRDRANRLRALGNAVVPQVAEFVGRMIMEADREAR